MNNCQKYGSFVKIGEDCIEELSEEDAQEATHDQLDKTQTDQHSFKDTNKCNICLKLALKFNNIGVLKDSN